MPLSVAAVGPRGIEAARQHTRRQPGVAHADYHLTPVAAKRAAQFEERQTVGQPRGFDCDLHDTRSGGVHGAGSRREIGRHAVEIVRRQHDPIGVLRNQPSVESGTELDVHEFGAQGQQRLREDGLALSFQSRKSGRPPRSGGR